MIKIVSLAAKNNAFIELLAVYHAIFLYPPSQNITIYTDSRNVIHTQKTTMRNIVIHIDEIKHASLIQEILTEHSKLENIAILKLIVIDHNPFEWVSHMSRDVLLWAFQTKLTLKMLLIQVGTFSSVAQ